MISEQEKYKIVKKGDDSTKVILNKEKKAVVMPGVGKVLGSIKGPDVPGGQMPSKSSSLGPPVKRTNVTVL